MGRRLQFAFPLFLVPHVLHYMAEGHEDGTPLVPEWHSAPWLPLLITKHGFVIASLTIQPYKGIFIPGASASYVFTTDGTIFLYTGLETVYMRLPFISLNGSISLPFAPVVTCVTNLLWKVFSC